MSLGNTPVQIKIEDLHVVVAASTATEHSPEEDEERAQALKFERLQRAETMRFDSPTDGEDA